MPKTLQVTSPFDGHLIEEYPFDDAMALDAMIKRAERAFKEKDSLFPLHKRIPFFERVAHMVSERQEAFALKAAEEGGKPLKDSRIELKRAVQGILEAARSVKDVVGREIPMGLTESSNHRMAYTFCEPIGVVGAISAFNHPFNLIVHQVIPALAVGAPVIVKPDLRTPISCLNLVEILHQAGLPKQMCQVLLCDNELAEQFVTDPRINFVTFIGSAKVGWKLRSKIAPGTRITLEHGGAAPVILEPDADLEKAIPLITKGGLYHAGQVCISVQRLFVHEKIIDQVATMLLEECQKLVVGDPLDEKTDVGPIITNQELKRIQNWIDEAGGKRLCGGEVIHKTCLMPTLLLNPSEDAKVSLEEIFGPVICLYSYKSIDEAIDKANSLPYSFQSAIFTKNLDRSLEAIRKLDASCVLVNDHTAFRVDWMPFYGRKQSGIGVGGILPMMQEMTEEKLFIIQSDVL